MTRTEASLARFCPVRRGAEWTCDLRETSGESCRREPDWKVSAETKARQEDWTHDLTCLPRPAGLAGVVFSPVAVREGGRSERGWRGDPT